MYLIHPLEKTTTILYLPLAATVVPPTIILITTSYRNNTDLRLKNTITYWSIIIL